MMAQQREELTVSVRKVIPLYELAPLAVMSCAYLVFLAGSQRGAMAISLVALGMCAANFLRACCQWYNTRHPDETER
jgi:hypothetical protein